MENNRFEIIKSRSTRFENIEVDLKIETKNKVLKLKKSLEGTKIEVSKK